MLSGYNTLSFHGNIHFITWTKGKKNPTLILHLTLEIQLYTLCAEMGRFYEEGHPNPKLGIWDFRNYDSYWEIHNVMTNFQLSHLHESVRELRARCFWLIVIIAGDQSKRSTGQHWTSSCYVFWNKYEPAGVCDALRLLLTKVLHLSRSMRWSALLAWISWLYLKNQGNRLKLSNHQWQTNLFEWNW